MTHDSTAEKTVQALLEKAVYHQNCQIRWSSQQLPGWLEGIQGCSRNPKPPVWAVRSTSFKTTDCTSAWVFETVAEWTPKAHLAKSSKAVIGCWQHEVMTQHQIHTWSKCMASLAEAGQVKTMKESNNFSHVRSVISCLPFLCFTASTNTGGLCRHTALAECSDHSY